jgi:hypothetical protein
MKNPKMKYLIPIALLAVLAMVPRRVGRSDGQKVRPPAVAGAFYPADPKELTQMIDGFLAHASVPNLQEPLVALISPHAG